MVEKWVAPGAKKKAADEMYPLARFDGRRATVQELCSKLETDSCFGLTRSEAERRLARDGKNLIFPSNRSQDFSRFLTRMFCGVSLSFWLIALICVVCFFSLQIIENQTNYCVLVVFTFSVLYAIFVGAFFYIQSKSDSFTETLPNMSRKIEVLRDGRRMNVPAEDIVVGDVVMLQFGEPIPADVHIIESQNFKVENSTLMGIAEQHQLKENIKEKNTVEISNVALFSGVVVEGTARGIVLRTGRRTLLGQIIGSRKVKDILICPIVKKLIDSLNWVALFSVLLAVVLCGIFLLTSDGQRLIDALIVAAAVIMATVPESLFPATLIVLYIYGRKMFSKDCKMRNIRAIQKLPFVKTICLMKPGVLTMNRAIVSNLWFDGKGVEVWGGTKVPLKMRSSSTFREFALCAVLCNGATFKQKQDHIPVPKREIVGSSDEVAILKFFAMTVGKKIEGMREAYPKLLWDTYANFQVSVHRIDDEILVVLVGEPDILLDKCVAYSLTGNDEPITDEFTRKLDRACVQFANNGHNLKCVIRKRISTEGKAFDVRQFRVPESEYTFLCLLALSDYTRPNIAQTITKCREAGIKVILATSDHPITAKTFARSIGLITEGSTTAEEKMEAKTDTDRQMNAIVIDGMQLDRLTKKGVEKLLAKYTEVVFARASIIQKLMLLEMCQQDNSIVAVVGDGIRDVLTMKKADLSITLSDGKSEWTDPVADVCLSDETFYSLATCIEEGRTIYENLKKSSAFLLAGVVPSVVPIVVYCVLGPPLPVSIYGFVVVKFLLELFPAVALMFEKPDPATMSRPPRKLTDPIWSRQMFFYCCAQIGAIEVFACFYVYFVIMLEYGWTPRSIVGIRDVWENKYVTDLEDSHGQRWSYAARDHLKILSQTGYFYAFIAVQCANILECRNQWVSIFKMKERNWMIHFSMLLMISLTFILIYISHWNILIDLEPLKAAWWVLPLPYVFLIMVFDEVKKYIIRKNPKGWLARETVFE